GHRRHHRRPDGVPDHACRHAGRPGRLVEVDQGGAGPVLGLRQWRWSEGMIPAAFEYERATSVQQASELLQRFGEDAKVLAGGHSLIPLMRLRLSQPSALVDINGI